MNQDTNITPTENKKWYEIFNHYHFTWLVVGMTAFIALLVGVSDATFQKVGSSLISMSLYTLVFILFVKFFVNVKYDVEKRLFKDPIALAIFLGLYGLGLSQAAHISLF